MQVLVLYYSHEGNTRDLAHAIAKGVAEVPGVRCIVRSTSEVTLAEFTNSQGIIAGSPVYFGTMAAELKAVFERYVDARRRMGDKVGAAFTTSGDPCGGRETTMLSIIEAMLIYGMIVVGDPLDATGHYGVSCVGAPDELTRENGAKLGRRVAELVVRIHGQ